MSRVVIGAVVSALSYLGLLTFLTKAERDHGAL